jgi:hypothetical protein
MKIKLLPTNNRLKQLIKEHGDIWIFIERRFIQCFNDIGIKIQSVNGEHQRWIRENDFIKIGK